MGLGIPTVSASAETEGTKIDFGRDIQPILSNRCFKCHGPDANQRQAGLRLDSMEHLTAETDSGLVAVTPGSPLESELYLRITHHDAETRMPPEDEGEPISAADVEQIKLWIEQGANAPPHWAFVTPRRPPVPEVLRKDWPRGPIDCFVLARLENEGWTPSEPASRRTLIRRLSFDLLGLPPTIADVEAFVSDRSADAYERLVDRMLDSPHYGERMAQDWLDLARYADTTGFAADSPRPMWLYRDWVIGALNDNMPFDQFTVAQLAGDMLPNATDEDRLATGFHRSSMQALGNNPPKEEFRVKGIIDRVNTTGRVWLGLALSCAECHSHKFDPITQQDYYSLYAIFNNIPHYGQNLGVHGPRIKTRSPLAPVRREQIETELADLRKGIPAVTEQEWERREQVWDVEMAQLLSGPPSVSNSGGANSSPKLVAHWPLDGNLADRSAVPVAAALHAKQPTWAQRPAEPSATGSSERALKLDSGEFVQIAATENIRPEKDFTVTARIQTTASEADIVCYYDSARGERAFVFGIGGEGEANAIPGNLYAWVSRSKDQLDGVQIYGSIPVNDGKVHHVALVFKAGESIDLYVDGKRDAAAGRVGDVPDVVATADCDLLLGAGYGLKEDEKSYFLEGLLWDVRLYRSASPRAAKLGLLPPTIIATLSKQPSERSRVDAAALRDFFRQIDRTDMPPAIANQIDGLLQERESLARESEAQVMLEMEEPRKTHVHIRGDFSQLGDAVEPAVPAFFSNRPEASKIDRLAFARWMVRPDHPLTARVAVNRFWQHYFGTGLVATPDDFGLQGERPSHPALLDWLATEFVESGWDMKAMQRLIVNSSAYRQHSATTRKTIERDPENRMLARGPRFRLPAEQIRDNALAVSGLLYKKMGGPSFYPPQPEGLFEEKGQLQYHPVWINSSGRDQYRRGLYVYWKRMNLYPSLAAFGAPTRERCSVERSVTNTPLQALVLLNDPVYIEAARAFADQVMAHGGDRTDAQIDYAMQRCLSRPPTGKELDRYTKFLNRQTDHYEENRGAAMQLLHEEETTSEPRAKIAERAAWTLLANVLLNLDETLSKP